MSRIFKSVDEIQPVRANGTDKLGAGSFSKVNLVCHKQNPSKWYAMKEVTLKTEKDHKMVFQEIQLHMTLNHGNIIRFEDYLETPDKVYIFLEYASNGDLFAYINKNKPSEAVLLRIFYQSCRAIEYIHSKNIMHRDLKPENILLDKDLNVKICDFGWSAEYYEGVNRETLCGTYEYMAPEVFFRNKQTKKTDIWALGVLLYELFHGYAPFRGTRMDFVMQAIMKNVIAFKKLLNPDIKDLILKILIFDPKKRPGIAEVLQHSLVTNFVCKREELVQDKENVEKISHTVYSNTKIPKKKPFIFAHSFYNTMGPNCESKPLQNNYTGQQSFGLSPGNSSVISYQKSIDHSSHFKKKVNVEEFSSAKQYNSVDKVSASANGLLKRYNTSQFQPHSGSSTQNVYSSKLMSANQSFNNSVSLGTKVISQRTIRAPSDIYGSGHGLNIYTRSDFSDAQRKNLYKPTTSTSKYNIFKQRTGLEGEKSFASQFNTSTKW